MPTQTRFCGIPLPPHKKLASALSDREFGRIGADHRQGKNLAIVLEH
jgi:hypothetical protein